MIRIDALMAEGFSRREIRRFIRLGVLPHANGRGVSAYYDDIHLYILRRIREARENHRTLSDIAEEVRLAYPSRFKPDDRRDGRAHSPQGPHVRRRTVYAEPVSWRD